MSDIFDPVEIMLAGRPMGKERVKPNSYTAQTHMYTPERTVAFEGRFALEGQRVMIGRPLLRGPLVLDATAIMPIPESKSAKWKREALAGVEMAVKKPDADNMLKMVDGLNMVVWVDDAQLVDVRLRKFYGAKPLFAVRIRRATAEEHAVPAWVGKFLGPTNFPLA